MKYEFVALEMVLIEDILLNEDLTKIEVAVIRAKEGA